MRKETEKTAVINLLDFWEKVARSEANLLALDYDGTLAPFRVNRMEARPLPGIKSAIAELAGSIRTRVAIVSGRPLQELSLLLGELKVTLIGSHGFEIRSAEGERLIKNPNPAQIRGLEKAEIDAVNLGVGSMLEKKIAGLAFHTRGTNADEASALVFQIEQCWTRIAGVHELECRRFNGGIELRSKGWHKGNVLLMLIEAVKPALTVYVGDDETDEDAFKALTGRGIGIKVGVPWSETAAQGFLPDCESVRGFLLSWLSTEHRKE